MNRKKKNSNIDKIASFVFGVCFIVTMIVLSIKFPYPTDFQLFTFRIVLSLSVAGVFAMIPGLINFESRIFKNVIRANGAIVGFLLIYQTNPPELITTPVKTLSPSAGLAYGYYNNFLTPISQSLTKTDSIEINNQKISLNQFKNISLKIIVPSNVELLSLQNISLLRKKHLKEIEVNANHRKYHLYSLKNESESQDELTLIDVPTTSNVIKEYLRRRTGKPLVDWNSPEVIDLTHEELLKFKETLELLLSENNLSLNIKLDIKNKEEIEKLLTLYKAS
jgi:hypothetical protein